MTKSKASILLSALFFVLFSSLCIMSTQYSQMAMYFPFFISLMASIAAFCNTILEYVKYRRVKRNDEAEEPIENEYDTPIQYETIVAAKNFLWILFYLIAIFLVGFVVGTAVFLLAFFKFKTDFNWLKIAIAIAVVMGFIYFLETLLPLHWPSGILFDIFQ